jgi:hypothetical protein
MCPDCRNDEPLCTCEWAHEDEPWDDDEECPLCGGVGGCHWSCDTQYDGD